MMHGIKTCYLHQPRTNTRIISHIDSAIASLKQPLRYDTTGLLTAELFWDGMNADLDLHVSEPDGVIVDWNMLMNNSADTGSGSISYDSRYGAKATVATPDGDYHENGLEVYAAGCDALKLGDYKIGVKYYDGDTAVEPMTLNVNVTPPEADRADGGALVMTTNTNEVVLRSRPSDPVRYLFNVNVSTSLAMPNGYQFVVTRLF